MHGETDGTDSVPHMTALSMYLPLKRIPALIVARVYMRIIFFVVFVLFD